MSPHTTWAAVGKCGKLLFARGKVMNAFIKCTREFFSVECSQMKETLTILLTSSNIEVFPNQENIQSSILQNQKVK